METAKKGRDPYVTFSVRLPLSVRRRAEDVGRRMVWSRNRTIEQALIDGLTGLESRTRKEAAARG
jgi:hypothetical protein